MTYLFSQFGFGKWEKDTGPSMVGAPHNRQGISTKPVYSEMNRVMPITKNFLSAHLKRAHKYSRESVCDT